MRRVVLLASFLIVVAGCGGTTSPGQRSTGGSGTGSPTGSATSPTTPVPSPVPSPGPARGANEWRLRYVLLDHYSNFAYCDPDLYPVARDDEPAAADRWWAGADRGSPEVMEILEHHGYRVPLTGGQRLRAYRDHKKLTVIVMRRVPGGYEFELSIGPPGGEPDQTIAGTITAAGQIDERSRRPRAGGCPICLEAATHIATPGGEVPVADLRQGDLVWTLDLGGRRIAAPVVLVARRATPGPHLMLRLVLSDGRILIAAGAHPDMRGDYLRQLRTGQPYDGAAVSSVEWIRGTAPATFDILPAGPTGNYWANGVLVGSTLR